MVLCISANQHGWGTAGARHSMCELARISMAGARHGMCELAFSAVYDSGGLWCYTVPLTLCFATILPHVTISSIDSTTRQLKLSNAELHTLRVSYLTECVRLFS
jgi:hypothetical protein